MATRHQGTSLRRSQPFGISSQITSHMVDPMKDWPVQDAKARFSELLDTCLREGPQLVTRRGADAAVLVPVDQWQSMARSIRPTLKELLLSDTGRFDLVIPPR